MCICFGSVRAAVAGHPRMAYATHRPPPYDSTCTCRAALSTRQRCTSYRLCLPLAEELRSAAEGENPMAIQNTQAFEYLEHQAGCDPAMACNAACHTAWAANFANYSMKVVAAKCETSAHGSGCWGGLLLRRWNSPGTWQVRCQMAWYTA